MGYSNGWASTITTGPDDVATSVTPTSVTGLPSMPFQGLLRSTVRDADDLHWTLEEIVTVTAESSGDLTITRAAEAIYDGTQSAVDFSGGAAVIEAVLTAAEVDAKVTTTVATDPIYDAKGDLPVGTGSNTAARLAVGDDGQAPMGDSTAAGGLSYGSSALWEAVLNGYAPVHWWKFDEASGDFADSGSAGGLTLTASGTINYRSADPWGGTSCAELTATGPGKGVSSGLGSIPTGANPRTVLMLCKTGSPQAGTKAIVTYGTGSANQFFMYQVQNGTNSVGDIYDLWSNSLASQGPKLSDGNWHVLALGITGAGWRQILWMDGTMIGRTTVAAANTTGGYFSVNPDGEDLYVADVAVFSSWLGSAKLARLWDIVRAAIA